MVTVSFEESLEGYTGVAYYINADGEKTAIANGDTITVAADVKIVVTYTADQYALTVKAEDDKIIKLGETNPFAAFGEKISIPAELIADGYEALTAENISVKNGNDDVEFTFEGGNIKFTMPAGKVSVNVAVPAKTQYKISVTSDEGYTVLVDGKPYAETAEEEGTTVNKPVVGSVVKIVPAAVDGKTAKITVSGIAEEDITVGEDGSVEFTAPAADITAEVAYEAIKYAVAAAENDKGTVAFTAGVDEDGKSTIGTEIKFTVEAGSAYEVRTVYVNGAAVVAGDDGAYSYTMTAADAEVTVEYGLKTFKLTIANNANVTGTEISIVCADNAENESTTEIHAGDVVTIKPTCKTGYSVSAVTYVVGGKTVKAEKTEDGAYTFTVPDTIDAAVTVRYTSGVTKYAVSYEKTDAIAEITVPAEVNYGKSLTVEVKPAGGYQIDNLYYVTADGEIEFTKNSTRADGTIEYVIAEIYADGALKFVTSAREYTITNNAAKTEDDKDGWIDVTDKARTGDVVTITVTSGEEMTVTYTEADGYDYTLKITGKKTGNDVEVSDGKFTMPSEDIEVVLTRTPVDYTIAAVTTSHVTISAAEEEGTVPAAGGKFNVEAPVKFKVAADAGYENIVVSYKTVEGTSDEGETIYSEPTVVTAVDEVYTISALKSVVIEVTASAKTYSIATANSKYMDDTTDGEYADGAKGTSIVPESAATDSTVEIKVTANEGYTVAAVEYAYTPDGAEEATTAGAVYNEEPSKFEFTMPAAEISSVTIKYAAVRNNVTVDAVNCEVKGNVENVQVNTTVTFTITPDENYRVNKNNITVTCGDKSVDFTLTGNELSFTMPNGEVTVAVAPTAEYEITAADIMGGIVTFKNLTTATGATEFTSSVMAIDGDEIEIKVESSDGYTPVAVYYGDDEVTADHDTGKYIVSAAAGKTVSVEYDVQEYTITADSVDGKYDLEVSETKLGVGEYVSGTVNAADGYKVTGVEVTYGVEQTVAVKFNDKTGKFNFTMPAGNVTVKAVYEAVDYTVTVTEKSLPDKGEVTLTVGGSAADAFHVGNIVTVKTKVENGYKHTISVKDAEGNSLLGDGAETSTSKSFTFTMPAGDVSYEGRTYGITANDATYKNEDRVYTAPDLFCS